jgi:hypothetical protein
VPLLSLASAVERVDQDLVPPLRGSDRQYAFRPGADFRARVADSRTVTLGLWLLGQDSGGVFADWPDQYAAAERALVRLLRPDASRQFAITRTWTDDLGSHTATGHGIADSVQRVRHGAFQGRATVDVHMADPFFYGSALTVNLPVGPAVLVDNPGDELTTAASVEFRGQLSNPTLTNSTPAPDVWLKVGTDIAAGDKVTADGTAASVVRGSDAANLIGALTHSGARSWFGLGRGSNSVTLSADGGTGSAVLTFQPVYY